MLRTRYTCLGALLAVCILVPARAQDPKTQLPPAGKPAKPEKEKETEFTDASLPEYEKELPARRPQGGQWSEVFFVNATDESIIVGLRAGLFGKNIGLTARGAAQIKIPNGSYAVYYLIPKEPKKELVVREASDSIHSPDGVAQLLKVDRAARGSKVPPGGTPTSEEPVEKKVLTLYRGKGITLNADNYVLTLSPGRGDALAEVKQDQTKKEETANRSPGH